MMKEGMFGPLKLAQLAQGIRENRFTCEALARYYLARIEKMEPSICAWQWLDSGHVLNQARQADRHVQDGLAPGGLHGIPVGVKDIINTRGISTEMGSAVFAHHVPDLDATIVKRFKEAGAFVMGKTVTAELAFLYPGKTRNPWNGQHTPGGSSSGSAAAVAAGFTPVALGTQTNGSVIRPAAYCGVVGYKPSLGLISRHGVHELSRSLDQVGVFARHVEDAACFASYLTGYDPNDEDSIAAGCLHPGFTPAPVPAALKLAAVRTSVWNLADAIQQEMFAKNSSLLKDRGARVENVELGEKFHSAHETHKIIMFYEGARAMDALQHNHRERISPVLNQLIDEGRTIPQAHYGEALVQRDELRRELENLFDSYDAVLTPPATGAAPVTLTSTGNPAFCTVWTLCGVPAITLPCGLSAEGLPLGVQLVGAYLKDDHLLRVAQWCESQIGFGSPGQTEGQGS
jgi:Asp-tRNA(Asn)/Glu-tRNA(Gln) amidotransferase A subunit family amidase